MLLRFIGNPLYTADTGAGSGGAGQVEDTAQTGDATGQGQQAQQQNGGEEKRFTQAELDEQIRLRLDRQKRHLESEQEKAKAAAAQKTLEEQGEFKTLAEQRQAKIAELEQQLGALDDAKEQTKRYKEALEKQLEALKKDLPAHIVTLLAKSDAAEQLAWLAENKDALGQQNGNGKQPSRGTPSGQQQQRQVQRQQEQQQRKPEKPLVRF